MKIRYKKSDEKPCGLCGRIEENRGCRIVMNKNKELLKICNICYQNLKKCMEKHNRDAIMKI